VTNATLSDGLLDSIWAAYAARGIGPNHVLIGSGVRHQLIDQVRNLRPTRIALLMDASPMRSPEGSLKDWVAEQLAGLAVPLEQVILPADTTADEAAVERATAGCASADVVVTVGSGTISDLGKVAAGHRPHLIVQTAASVNGYADNESVLLRSGVKRTAHSAYAHTLLVDVDIIALAPPELNRSGLGDMISMSTAPADWYLASQLGMDANWSEDAALLARRYGRQLMAASAGIGGGNPADLELLGRLLTLSGISMGMAGQTSPSSGMEHTVSHMLDMWATARHRPHRLHGAQVGVTTLWSSLLWQRVVTALDSGLLPEVRIPSPAEAEPQVRAVFDLMDPSGRSGDECWSDYSAKLSRMQSVGFAEKVQSLVAAWPSHRQFLTEECLMDPREIAVALTEAGALAQADDLDAGDREPTVWALTNNHLMRNRFNVCDLAFAAGLWNERVARDLIQEADQLVASTA